MRVHHLPRRGAGPSVIAVTIAAITVAALAAAPGAASAADSEPPGDDSLTSIAVTRISGADRYDLAVQIAKQAKPAGADVVYVASGAAFPDALSAGPAAVREHGALLLTAPDALPTAVQGELAALHPRRIVVVGGAASVTDATYAAISATVPSATISRVAGADRYEVSIALATNAFPRGGVLGAFLATGRNFPDALSAGAAAGATGSPVVLIDGLLPGVDIPTMRLLDGLGASSVALIGGTTSVVPEVESSLKLRKSVTRVAGADRYQVSMNINDLVSFDFSTVYLATGSNFPDALAGGVLAGTKKAPLYVVPPDCVPAHVLAQLSAEGTRSVVLLGGSSSLTDALYTLPSCGW